MTKQDPERILEKAQDMDCRKAVMYPAFFSCQMLVVEACELGSVAEL